MKKVFVDHERELVDATLIVILVLVLLGVFVAGIDVFLSKGIHRPEMTTT